MRPGGFPRSVCVALVIAATAAVVTACSGSVRPNPPSYYLALGDSLAQGVQPNPAGVSVETPDGYPDQLYAALLPGQPSLRLVKLGCPGETTGTMIHGGMCRYQGGSQLAAAVAFLHAHRGRVRLVTIDIGANDTEQCGAYPALGQLASCAVNGVPAVSNLTSIVASLKAAAGPGVRIVGMTYYLPALSEWLTGTPGQAIARVTEKVAAAYNQMLGNVYTQAGVPVADVFGAFRTADFTASGRLPRNVALLCRWTWACATPPRGPNQHANQAGYQVIARSFQRAAGLG